MQISPSTLQQIKLVREQQESNPAFRTAEYLKYAVLDLQNGISHQIRINCDILSKWANLVKEDYGDTPVNAQIEESETPVLALTIQSSMVRMNHLAPGGVHGFYEGTPVELIAEDGKWRLKNPPDIDALKRTRQDSAKSRKVISLQKAILKAKEKHKRACDYLKFKEKEYDEAQGYLATNTLTGAIEQARDLHRKYRYWRMIERLLKDPQILLFRTFPWYKENPPVKRDGELVEGGSLFPLFEYYDKAVEYRDSYNPKKQYGKQYYFQIEKRAKMAETARGPIESAILKQLAEYLGDYLVGRHQRSRYQCSRRLVKAWPRLYPHLTYEVEETKAALDKVTAQYRQLLAEPEEACGTESSIESTGPLF